MQRIILPIGILVLAVLIFMMWTKPIWGTITDMKAAIANLDEALLNAREIQSERDELLTTYNSIPTLGVERIDQLLPSSVSSVQFIIEIESMLKKQGLILKSIDVGDPEDKNSSISAFQNVSEPFERIPLSISIVGSYSAFVSFLEQLSRSLRLVDIESINFTASKENSYEFSVEAVTFWKRAQ